MLSKFQSRLILSLLLFLCSWKGVCQSNIILKKGMKLHYSGDLVTDTLTEYPAETPFSNKNYNAKFGINDLILTVDTVIHARDYTFARFLVDLQNPGIYNTEARFNFFPSEEPFLSFNLLFYKDFIFTFSPPGHVSNYFGYNWIPLLKDKLVRQRYDSASNSNYRLYYTNVLTNNGCLEHMLTTSTISNDGKIALGYIQNGAKDCNFTIDPIINISGKDMCNGKLQNADGQSIYCFSRNDSLNSAYRGPVKVFRRHVDYHSESYLIEYYYSDKFFISKIVCDFKWSRFGGPQEPLRGEPPAKYTLNLFKIDQ